MVGYKYKIQLVKDYLEAGNSLTSMEAINKWKATRLSAIIYDLKKRGMPIQNLQRKQNTTYAVYKLVK